MNAGLTPAVPMTPTTTASPPDVRIAAPSRGYSGYTRWPGSCVSDPGCADRDTHASRTVRSDRGWRWLPGRPGVFVQGYPAQEFLVAGFVGLQHLAEADFFPPAVDGGPRNAVGEAERRALGDVRSVEVRQIAPRIAGPMLRAVRVAFRPGRGLGLGQAAAHPGGDFWLQGLPQPCGLRIGAAPSARLRRAGCAGPHRENCPEVGVPVPASREGQRRYAVLRSGRGAMPV